MLNLNYDMNLKLFFIDDDEIQNDIMKEYMNYCEVPQTSHFYTNGFEALKYLNEVSTDLLPNVLFIDVFMPLIDGWEILAQLESIMKNRQWSPSIYMVTSSVSKRDQTIAASQKHLKAFLNKPLKLNQLKPILQDEYNALPSVSE